MTASAGHPSLIARPNLLRDGSRLSLPNRCRSRRPNATGLEEELEGDASYRRICLARTMTDRSRRPRPGEIGAEEREQFEKAGLRSDEDFLDALALDFDEGVKNLAKRVELPVERL